MEGFFIRRSTVFLITIHIALSSVQYFFESGPMTWTQARRHCEGTSRQLASGNINDIKVVLPIGKSAFIGMVEIDEWLWFEGCYTIRHDMKNIRVQNSNSSVLFSSCVAKCHDYKYIAVSKSDSCYCIDNEEQIPDSPISYCNIFSDISLMYGDNYRWFLYRMDHGNTSIEKQSTDPRYGSIRLKDKRLSGRSYVEKQSVLYNGTLKNGQNSTVTWKRAVQLYHNGAIYFVHKQFSSYFEQKEVETVNCISCSKPHDVWVGLFKLTVQKQVLKDVNLRQISNYSCGRLYKRSDSTVNVTYERCDEKVSFICETLTETNNKSNKGNQTENNVDLEQKSTDNWNLGGKGDTTFKDSPHHPSTTSEFPAVAYEGNGSKETDLTVVLCALAGVLVLIIAIAVGYKFIRRFKRQKNEKVLPEDRYVEVRYIPEDREANKEATVHTLDAEKDKIRDVTNDTAGPATEGEYDVFCRRHQKTDTAEDLYDHARAPNNDDNYDHMPNFKVPNVDAGNIYDHTTNIQLHRTGVDDTYDHTHIAHAGADNYDHLANVTPNDQKDINNYDCA